MFQSLAAGLQRRFPPDDVRYVNDLARMTLTLTVTVAAIMFIANGGQLLRMAPTT